jgi:hypothetical protein
MARKTLSERFWSKVVKSEGCWEHRGSLNYTGGYPREGHDYAHRVSWRLHVGDIPDGRFVCHRCDNRRCVRPEHLFIGTHDDNMSDMVTKGRQAHGERGGGARLTNEQAAAIFREYEQRGGLRPMQKQRELAERFGVARSTIANIVYGHEWRLVVQGAES